jgi:hypothetical protein
MFTTTNTILDYPFAEYCDRIVENLQWEQQQIHTEKIKKSDKFEHYNRSWKRNAYEGYAVLSMVQNNPGNEALFEELVHLKHILEKNLANPEAYFMLPEDSYHQTIANTLSSHRFYENIKARGLENEYPEMIQRAFDAIGAGDTKEDPIYMRMKGFSIFGTCLALLGTFELKNDYLRIIDFRNKFYNLPELNNLDIRRTRPFIGHITFSYIGSELDPAQKGHLLRTIVALNREIGEKNLYFKISKAELRKFHNLAQFDSLNPPPSTNL